MNEATNETLSRLHSFVENWRGSLEIHADVTFHSRKRGDLIGAPAQVADCFVGECGHAPIGFHWEMLDAEADPDAPRSALGAFKDALAKDLVMRSHWLGREQALACGTEFIRAFASSGATILTNHIIRDGGKSEGWNPISRASLEWAFVGMDDSAIALLLLTAED